jgi:hypothetical protein
MKPILLIGRARCGKTIVAETLQEMGFYIPSEPIAQYDFESLLNPECFEFFEAIRNNEQQEIKNQLEILSIKYHKLALKSHMLIFAWKYVDAKIIVCHRRDRAAQIESMRVFVRDEPIEQLKERLEEYDRQINEIPDKLDWYLEDYWNDPETEIKKVCNFVNIKYKENFNKFNPTKVGK